MIAASQGEDASSTDDAMEVDSEGGSCHDPWEPWTTIQCRLDEEQQQAQTGGDHDDKAEVTQQPALHPDAQQAGTAGAHIGQRLS